MFSYCLTQFGQVSKKNVVNQIQMFIYLPQEKKDEGINPSLQLKNKSTASQTKIFFWLTGSGTTKVGGIFKELCDERMLPQMIMY